MSKIKLLSVVAKQGYDHDAGANGVTILYLPLSPDVKVVRNKVDLSQVELVGFLKGGHHALMPDYRDYEITVEKIDGEWEFVAIPPKHLQEQAA